MIKLKIENKTCDIKIDGGKLDCLTEATLGFMYLAEAVAPAVNMSFESAALLLYQQAVMAKKRHEVEKSNDRS